MDQFAAYEFVRQKLEERRGQWKQISEQTGIPYKTIKNFMQGKAKFPRPPMIAALHEHLSKPA